jgi:hypothetical protein
MSGNTQLTTQMRRTNSCGGFRQELRNLPIAPLVDPAAGVLASDVFEVVLGPMLHITHEQAECAVEKLVGEATQTAVEAKALEVAAEEAPAEEAPAEEAPPEELLALTPAVEQESLPSSEDESEQGAPSRKRRHVSETPSK